MDIVIRNGIIEDINNMTISNKFHDKNKLKRSYDEFNEKIPGPYYDLLDNHLHIPRKISKIKNFVGPQNPYETKIIKDHNFKSNNLYCTICHTRIFLNKGYNDENKHKIVNIKKNNLPNIELLKISRSKDFDIISSWRNLLIKYNKYLNEKYRIFYKKKQILIINKYQKLVYKLLYEPILYDVNEKQTNMIWPWNLTVYQNFKLNNPNYKNSIIFLNDNKISNNFAIIQS
jgi:hypothetical protein